MTHRGLFAGLVSALLASSASAAAPKYRVQWLLGHKNLDYFEEAAREFKAAVESRSGGEIAVDIVPESPDSAPEAPEIAGKVARGEAQLGHSFVDVLATLDPRLCAFEAPFLLRSDDHMEGVLDGPVGGALLAGLREKRLVGLSFTYSGGASGVATASRPIRAPNDLKGLKVGIYGDEAGRAWLESLGAAPVSLGHDLDRILPLAAKGGLDAVVVTPRNFERARLDRAFRYFNMPGSSYLVSVTYANEKFFDALPPKYQALLIDESRKAGRVERAKTIKLNRDSLTSMAARGVETVRLTRAALEAFSKALAPVYAGALSRMLGGDLLERIRKAPDGTVQPVVPSGDFARL